MNNAIARVCHEVNRAYCEAIGDPVMPTWEDAPDWQRDSCLAGVRLHLAGEQSPAESHAAWLALKVAEGWIYGPVKDADAKTHPCCVPYSELPQAQRVKDFLFRAVVNAMRMP